MTELPALALPPIGGLVLLLFGYIALIGPINYLVLKRIDRREWAWVTMPALIAVFAAGAYAYGSALRGSDVIVNEVAIVRGAPDATEGSAQVYLGVFSPTRGTYQVALPGGALLSAPLRGDFFGGQGTVLDVDPGRAGAASATCPSASARCGRSGPRPRRIVPLVHAELQLRRRRRDRHGPQRLREDPWRHPAVVLGSNVVVLPDILPGQTADVRPAGGPRAQIGAMLSDKIVGQAFFGEQAASNERQRRDQTRHRVIIQLTYDPMFGNLSSLRLRCARCCSPGAAIRSSMSRSKASSRRGRPTSSTTSRVPMQIRGETSFGWDLMRSTVLAADAAFFSKDPYSMNFGQGVVTVAYRPIPFEGTMTPSKVLMSMASASGLASAASPSSRSRRWTRRSCASRTVRAGAPSRCRPDRPERRVRRPARDRGPRSGLTGEWRRLPHLTTGETYELKDPARYVDPSTGTIQVRFVNDGQDSVNVSFNVVIQGDVR